MSDCTHTPSHTHIHHSHAYLAHTHAHPLVGLIDDARDIVELSVVEDGRHVREGPVEEAHERLRLHTGALRCEAAELVPEVRVLQVLVLDVPDAPEVLLGEHVPVLYEEQQLWEEKLLSQYRILKAEKTARVEKMRHSRDHARVHNIWTPTH